MSNLREDLSKLVKLPFKAVGTAAGAVSGVANKTVMPVISGVANKAFVEPYVSHRLKKEAPGGKLKLRSTIGNHNITNLKVDPKIEITLDKLRPVIKQHVRISMDDTIGIPKKGSTSALARRKKKKEKEDRRRAGYLPLGATALGAGALAGAYGLGSDSKIEAVLKRVRDYKTDAFRSASKPGALPENMSELQYYQNILAPAAQLTPFGVPVGELLSKIRTSPHLMGNRPIVDINKLSEGDGSLAKVVRYLSQNEDGELGPISNFLQKGFNSSRYMLASSDQKEKAESTIASNLKEIEKLKHFSKAPGISEEDMQDYADKLKELQEENDYFKLFQRAPNSAGSSGAQHYAMFASGAVPAYAHMMKAHHKDRLVPNELLEKLNDPQKGVPVKYSDWMGRKLEDFVAKRTRDRINPFEFSLNFMSNDDQTKLMQEFHESLPPELQKYRLATEDLNDDAYVSQTGNYLPKGEAFAKFRNALKDVGIVAGASGVGGLAGNSLYNALTDDDEESLLGSSLSTAAGMGLGGAAGYWSRTAGGKQKINDALTQLMSNFSSENA